MIFYKGHKISLSELLLEQQHSLLQQSINSRLGTYKLNGDGMGVLWYVQNISENPALYRSIMPAWNNHNLYNVAHAIESNMILAHIRAATESSHINEQNCHPFRWGKLSFMHNGSIKPFAKIKRKLHSLLSDEAFASIQGTTDSEHIFALLIDDYLKQSKSLSSCLKLKTSILNTVNKLYDLSSRYSVQLKLNFILSDGYNTIVTRLGNTQELPSLFYSNSLNNLFKTEHDGTSVLVCSEPISTEVDWVEIPQNSIISINAFSHIKSENIY